MSICFTLTNDLGLSHTHRSIVPMICIAYAHTRTQTLYTRCLSHSHTICVYLAHTLSLSFSVTRSLSPSLTLPLLFSVLFSSRTPCSVLVRTRRQHYNVLRIRGSVVSIIMILFVILLHNVLLHMLLILLLICYIYVIAHAWFCATLLCLTVPLISSATHVLSIVID